jgi:hypothetical protein
MLAVRLLSPTGCRKATGIPKMEQDGVQLDSAGVLGLFVLPARFLPRFRGWQADFSYKNKRIWPVFPVRLPPARVFRDWGQHPNFLGKTGLFVAARFQRAGSNRHVGNVPEHLLVPFNRP